MVAKSGGNYTTITAALNAITPTATTPYVIEVWPGVYTEPNTVNLKSYVHLKGSGSDVTTIKTSVGTSATIISANGLTNVVVSGLTVTGGAYGISFYNTAGTISENLVLDTGTGIYVGGNIIPVPQNSIRITNNKISENSNIGIWVFQVNAVITGNVISGNRGGIGLSIGVASIISGNVITANGAGGGITSYEQSTNITISNNVITDNEWVGIEINSGGYITNNKIVNTRLGWDVLTRNDQFTIPTNISFNIFDIIASDPAAVGSYNVKSNGDPILIP